MTRKSESIRAAAALIEQSRRILVFTGAGVSTESGIPDFRGPDGIWTRCDPEDFTIERFLSDPKTRALHWNLFLNDTFGMIRVKPNAAHQAVTMLEKCGRLHAVVTQNVDGLHQKAGVSSDRVFELHGDLSHARCLDCGRRYPMETVVTWMHPGRSEPVCPDCGGMLKPDAVLFGEALPTETLAAAEHHAATCDLCLVMGSTLSVYPAALIPRYAVEAGAKLIIINLGATELDYLAHIRIEGKAGEIAPRLIPPHPTVS